MLQQAKRPARQTDLTEALELCREMGIEVIPTNVRRRPSQTHSVSLIAAMIRQHGTQHAFSVLATLMESENNRGHLVSPVIGAISDLYCRYPVWGRDIGRTLDVFDRIDLAAIRATARDAAGKDGKAPDKRQVIAGLLFQILNAELNQSQKGLFG